MENFRKKVYFFLLLVFPAILYAQKDITRFLDIPVDGLKSEMIQKLKSKGFTTNKYKNDVLDGEFNGTDVKIFIVTNNNKVWRIAVVDTNPTDEANIKIRFNNLIQQFSDNNRYTKEADSTIAKYSIPKDEDISYEITVNKKRYEAAFFQKSAKYDSLLKQQESLLAKDKLTNEENKRLTDIIVEIVRESLNSLNKQVWFMITESYGKYSIAIYYENHYNKAKGEGL